LGVYILLSFFYNVYLQSSLGGKYYPDFITNLVAKQSSSLISSFGFNAEVMPHPTEISMKLFIDKQFLGRIVEGCNAVSIIILFIAFIIPFTQKFKKTLLFILVGSVLIYVVNIIRIAILAIALYKYPEHQDMLHQIVFPAIIYGMVFLLWMLWVKMLPKTIEANE
jgi:exosortase family protein XrtF